MPTTPVLQVNRADIARTRLVDRDRGALPPGSARLRVDSFALTANNVTYAAYGDAMG